MPSYGEVNPICMLAILFPFFYGLMFSDVCHGLIIFVLGVYLCYANEIKRLDDTLMLKSLYGLRYVILLMGLCAMLCGAIYNEFSGLPMFWMKSCYTYYQNSYNF